MPEMISPFSFHCTIEWQLVSLQIINVPPTLPPVFLPQIFFRATQARLQDTFDVQVPENFIRFRAQQSFHVRQIGVLHCPRADDLRRRILAPLPEEIRLWIADPYVHHVARPRWRKKFLSRNRNPFLFKRSIQMVINRLRDYIQRREGKNNKLRGSNDDNWWTIVDATIA